MAAPAPGVKTRALHRRRRSRPRRARRHRRARSPARWRSGPHGRWRRRRSRSGSGWRCPRCGGRLPHDLPCGHRAYTALSVDERLATSTRATAPCATAPAAAATVPGAAGLREAARRPHRAAHEPAHGGRPLLVADSRASPPPGCPPFPDLSEDERWDLINFLRALSAAERARGLASVVEPNRPWLAAPDFAFSVGPARPRRSATSAAAARCCWSCSPCPASRPRLSSASPRPTTRLAWLGAEVIGVAARRRRRDHHDASPATRRSCSPWSPRGSEEIARAYSLFRADARARRPPARPSRPSTSSS